MPQPQRKDSRMLCFDTSKWFTSAVRTVIVPCVLSAAALIVGCNAETALVDGTYTAFAARADQAGWTAAAEMTVADGVVEGVHLDYIGQSGELLRHQAFVHTAWADEYGEDPVATLNELAARLESRDDASGSATSSIPLLSDQFTALMDAMLLRAQEGECAPILVETGTDGSARDGNDLFAAFGTDRRTSMRSMVRGGIAEPGPSVGGYAAVASHSLAVEETMRVLEAGGTAADAAVVLGTMMSVAEPFLSHALGGGSWILYFDATTGTVHSVDAVGPAPMAATAELFRREEFHGENGMHRSIVPGAWGGYIELLKEFGSMPLDELLAPAVEYARDGVPVSSAFLNWFPLRAEFTSTMPDSTAVFLPNGELPEVGSPLINENLSRTFAGLAEAYRSARVRGELSALEAAADYYYRGPIAEEIVRFSDENNGLFVFDDFNNFYDYGMVEPIHISYRGLDVYQNPPNSQGIAMLQALNILEGFDFGRLEPNHPEAIHLMAEAIKLAFADRNRYIADPRFYDLPVEALLSDEHAAAQRNLISLTESLSHPIDDVLGIGAADPRNTSTFHVVDRYGNMAAITSSIGLSFMVAGETGITMNERLAFMSTDPDDVNRIEPGKKVRHSAGPYLVVRDGSAYIAGGNTGADFQPQGQLQQFVNIVEFGLGPQDVVALPRFQPQAFAATNYPFAAQTRLALENGRYPQSVWDDLVSRGQNVEWAGYFGRQNVIVVEDHESGDIRAGSETREDDSLGMVGSP